MSAIGPGDWVECIQTVDEGVLDARLLGGGRIYKGRLYCVEAIMEGADENGDWDIGLRLTDPETHRTQADGTPGGWCVDLFRPIYRPRTDLIETLKQPAPDAVRALEPV